jgi:TatD DNase family protein
VLIDTHAHLGDEAFAEDRAAVLDRAFSAGVERIVEIADSPEEWDRAAALCAAHPGRVYCSLGLHPYYADRWTPELGRALELKAGSAGVVAVGEIGLDYARCTIPAEVQRESFRRMLETARGLRLPVVIHSRSAYEDILKIIEEIYKSPPETRFHGVLHCFSGTAEQALAACRLGFALGVDGPVTYPKNAALREAFSAAGLERLVLETDSPYLPPQNHRGQRNEPGLLPEIASALTAVFGCTKEKVADITTANARDLFGLDRA